ncbi:MAG TPA: methyltransferase domain-containing protein [Thermomicrobiales bacterium]|nr:methyltransferase domain-containing protein [Thermomicrobiales bacterium]
MPRSHAEPTEHVRELYDGLAPTWNAREARGERLLMGDRFRQELGAMLRGDVLELGSGTGMIFRFVDWDRITSFTATDLSPGMLAEARQRPEVEGRPVTFEQVEATDLPYPDASFDTVTTSLTLCTVPDPERTLREMSRVCRPDGRIVLLEHVDPPNPLLSGVLHLLSPLQERRMGCHLDRPTDRLVERMGFPIERHEGTFLSIFRLLVLCPLPQHRASGCHRDRLGPSRWHDGC